MSPSCNGPRQSTIVRAFGRIPGGGAPKLCIVVAMCIGTITNPMARGAPQSGSDRAPVTPPTLSDAQRLFYNARYEAAAASALALRESGADDLASDELRTSALLFQLKALLEGRSNKDASLSHCGTCPDLIAEFLADTRHGQSVARATLRSAPNDETALFYLGKLDLNYVWLQLGPLRHKTGWDEYWEARHSLDAVLTHDPDHVRARVARAWIDYIVDTKMPWGTRWVLGGGNRTRGLTGVRQAAQMDADFFTHAEAEFALWDMEVREHNTARATDVARRLARDFPDNRELAAFLQAREADQRQ